MAKYKEFKKVLIANRGEIAIRVARACRKMGIETVAVYSEVDRNALHVRYADEAYYIGPPAPAESYLNIEKIVEVAVKSGCDAVHPGYGFLSENSEFVKACEEAGITFIGPNTESMYILGDKTRARQRMIEAGVPVVPGTKDPVESLEHALKIAEEVGYPIMFKASAGGGGKGMRLIRSAEEFKEVYDLAKGEALSAFGDDRMYIEKAIEKPRHVEIQIARDKHGNAIHLFERECSIQRRHQKVIEESPSMAINDEVRHKMGEAAIRAVAAANYDSVGTVEFLVDKDMNFYFLEVNTRLQVEHPVTEMVTGIDIVKLQIEIAEGKPIPFKQEDIKQVGHAIECRIYAEDPDNNFMPSPGMITGLRMPGGPGVRVDSGVYSRGEVPLYYDPMVAKLIVWDTDRQNAIARMKRALKEFVVKGIKTTIPFHQKVLRNENFIKGNISTDFIDKEVLAEPQKREGSVEVAIAAAAIKEYLREKELARKVLEFKETCSYGSPWKEAGRRAAMYGVSFGDIYKYST
ncbi:acetyl-CoA carboxylase biotin carboxylase subunit [Hippea alviniae]|uniref:acetyl-CoA carboxylase biotin carboxylase subunit n=1 Tax=Hippea alviniae TaxID=1279027 RepID=UPI0003B726EF|nr:acetyl-CoA carboxylase biotin carboxylase subunit [Hippea alviniae]